MKNNKLKFIGYYCRDNQNMHPEEFRKEEAEALAEKFKKSFSELIDDELIDIINSNAVLIFRDKNYKLFAYFPSKHLVKITDVVYHPIGIIKVPFKLKFWFTPGEKVEVNTYPEPIQDTK